MNLKRFLAGIPFMKKKFYPVKVIIKKNRSSSILITEDRARRIYSDGGVEEYELYNNGDKFQPPEFDRLYLDGSGNEVLFLFENDKGEYFPIKTEFNSEEMKDKAIPKNVALWWLNQKKRISQRYSNEESWWKRHGAQMMVFGVVVLQLITLYISWKHLGGVATKLVSASKSIQKAVGGIPAGAW